MSLFSWFSDKSAAPAGRPIPGPVAHLVDRKIRRHARRELLYTAIRECMTRAGVLSATYKFKVLSLDQRGDKFLVMMDVNPVTRGQAEKLTEIETRLISTVKRLLSMEVTSVYWRTENLPVAASAVNFGISQPSAKVSRPRVSETVKNAPPSAVKTGVAQPYEPIDEQELAAFKRALVVPLVPGLPTPDATGKSRSGLRSFTLITGFEDTEIPESSAAPALSATQYGELR